MPVYRYKCEGCRDESTLIHGINEEPRVVCSAEGCTSEMKKTVARTSFNLKGGGWYKDGYDG